MKRSTFGRLLALAAPFWRRILLSALLGFATVASGIGLMMASAFIIAKAALHPSIAELQVAIVGVRFFGIARGIFRYLERLVSHDVNFRLLARIRVWFYERLEPLAPARLQRYRSGDLLTRIVTDVDTLENVFVRVLAPPLTAVGIVALMFVLLRGYSIGIAWTTVGFLILAGIVAPWWVRRQSQRPGRALVATRSELNATLVDGIQGMPDLLAYGADEAYLEKLNQLQHDLGQHQRRLGQLSFLNDANTDLLMNLATVAALILAIPLVTSSLIEGVYLPVIVLGIMAAFEAVAPLPQAWQYLDSTLAAARRLFEIVDAEPEVVPPEKALPLPENLDLAISDLSFRYHPTEALVLDRISFTLPVGARIAIVGPSGAGKTTLVDILLRFWDCASGSITFGDRDIRQLLPEQARELFSVVSQDTYLFNTSVRENLRLAKSDATDDEIFDAARQAQIHDFIQSLPDGYDSWVGEQGLNLSGGERQRLAIARALLKDASILILDEPTANLDAITEQEVWRAMQPLMSARSTLVITHRLVGLETMDEILVLRQGQIVGRGAHSDLLASNPYYQRMWEQQRSMLADVPLS